MNNDMNNQGPSWWGSQPVQQNFQPLPPNNQQMMMFDYSEMPPKKSKKKLIIILIIIALILGVGAWFVLTKTDLIIKHDNKKEEEKVVKKGAYKFQGVFERENYVLKIYPINESEFRFSITSQKLSVKGSASVKGATGIYGSFEDTITFTYTSKDNTITVAAGREDIPSDVYQFTKDYSVEEYFADSCGNPMYFDTKYNGYYTHGSNKMYIYQVNDTTCRVIIDGGSSVTDLDFNIQADGSLRGSIFDRVYVITFEDSKAIFKTTDGDDSGKDGTYKKQRKLKYEDVLGF